MWPLIRYNLLHLLRSKLIVFFILFSLLVQYVACKALGAVTIRIGAINVFTLNTEQMAMALFFVQSMLAGFLAVTYAMSIVPYLHRGTRAQLTFVLPVAKWKFPVAHGIIMVGLLMIPALSAVLSYLAVYGTEGMFSEQFPWFGLLMAFVMHTMALLVLMFMFSLLILVAGRLQTMFLGSLVLFALFIAGAILRGSGPWALLATQPQETGWPYWIYRLLPPFGELHYEVITQLRYPAVWDWGFLMWAIWLGIFGALYWWKLGSPQLARGSE